MFWIFPIVGIAGVVFLFLNNLYEQSKLQAELSEALERLNALEGAKVTSDARDVLDEFIKRQISAGQTEPTTEHVFTVVAEYIKERTRTILASEEETDTVKATFDRVIRTQLEATISTMGREPILSSIDPAIAETVTETVTEILNDNEDLKMRVRELLTTLTQDRLREKHPVLIATLNARIDDELADDIEALVEESDGSPTEFARDELHPEIKQMILDRVADSPEALVAAISPRIDLQVASSVSYIFRPYDDGERARIFDQLEPALEAAIVANAGLLFDAPQIRGEVDRHLRACVASRLEAAQERISAAIDESLDTTLRSELVDPTSMLASELARQFKQRATKLVAEAVERLTLSKIAPLFGNPS